MVRLMQVKNTTTTNAIFPVHIRRLRRFLFWIDGWKKIHQQVNAKRNGRQYGRTRPDAAFIAEAIGFPIDTEMRGNGLWQGSDK
jgi:hypothetical protein